MPASAPFATDKAVIATTAGDHDPLKIAAVTSGAVAHQAGGGRDGNDVFVNNDTAVAKVAPRAPLAPRILKLAASNVCNYAHVCHNVLGTFGVTPRAAGNATFMPWSKDYVCGQCGQPHSEGRTNCGNTDCPSPGDETMGWHYSGDLLHARRSPLQCQPTVSPPWAGPSALAQLAQPSSLQEARHQQRAAAYGVEKTVRPQDTVPAASLGARAGAHGGLVGVHARDRAGRHWLEAVEVPPTGRAHRRRHRRPAPVGPPTKTAMRPSASADTSGTITGTLMAFSPGASHQPDPNMPANTPFAADKLVIATDAGPQQVLKTVWDRNNKGFPQVVDPRTGRRAGRRHTPLASVPTSPFGEAAAAAGGGGAGAGLGGTAAIGTASGGCPVRRPAAA
ncbi:hypothetical protein HXX76_014387 [Chlamydomonas incerta]|uniref:Uncharacterized protein n=1 Tax=Chlamydomonas incerta TaxID=51695 RepID=A0A835VT92_CHLIN|nr:hypothetical protein HXX76_014387 [Chlamydomonas incerta]|eukprot:KAG2424664.1 hypothetical protein HXX76_014387 [Chlamydomonas incerta]